MTISNFVLLITTLCVGLMAGLFYSYSFSVTPGLSKLTDVQYITAMQSINRAIQNPIFFIGFFGALILLPVCTYLKFSRPVSLNFWLLLTATLVYFIGSFAVTAIGNIPLNNTLDKFDITTTSNEAISLQRKAFETKWNNLNSIRTIASVASFILIIVACIVEYISYPKPEN